jgi:hypothetical protein
MGMSKTCVLLLMVFLLVPAPSLAQTPRSAFVAANKSWPPFWLRFNRAIKNRDRVALRRMMADDFSDHGGGSPADYYVTQVFSKEMRREYQRALSSGTELIEYGEQPARFTRRKEYPKLIFEFGKDRRWRWIGLVGD